MRDLRRDSRRTMQRESWDIAENRFEIEVSDLAAHTHAPRFRRGSSSPLERRDVVAHACRLAVATLAALLLLSGLTPVQEAVDGLVAGLPDIPGGAPGAIAAADPWYALRQRALHLPSVEPGAPCPATPARRFAPGLGPGQGSGQVYAVSPGAPEGMLNYAAARFFGPARTHWGGETVVWAIALAYRGPVLVRGRQLDGTNELRFNGGVVQAGVEILTSALPLRELDLLAPSGGRAGSWSSTLTFTRVRAPGCYAYQVDGTSFSIVIVFRAAPVFSGPPPAGGDTRVTARTDP